MILSRRPHYLATANVDFAVQALRDVELQRILAEADLVLCDGMPLANECFAKMCSQKSRCSSHKNLHQLISLGFTGK
jgi:UDP-N-acetyl-D-mannosaminuronic acid transferase (WecB/TagA/CpsF family)